MSGERRGRSSWSEKGEGGEELVGRGDSGIGNFDEI